MTEKNIEISTNEVYSGAELIQHLIETARSFVDSDIEQAKDFFEKGLILSNNIQYEEGSGDCLFELGKLFSIQNKTLESFKYLQDAIGIYKQSGNNKKYFESCSFLANACILIGNYGQALELQVNALNTAQSLNDVLLLADAYNKTGNTNKVLTQYSKAIEYHEQALHLYGSINDNIGVSVTNFYIGNCLNWSGELEQAIVYLQISLDQANQLNNSNLKVKPLGSLATVYTKLKNYDQAIDLFYQAIDLVNLTDDKLLKADLLRNLGNLFTQTSQYDKAILSLSESLEIAKYEKRGYPHNLIHLGLAGAYEHTGDFKKSLEHYKLYHEISNELLNEEVALKTKGVHLKYDFEETKRKVEQAEKTVSLKDQFIANISHEIRTPLNGVLGMTDLLTETNPSAEQLEYINTIKLSANNLINIINDILDFSTIQSGELVINKSNLNIRDLLADVAQVLNVKSNEKNINLLLSLDNDIPDIIIGDELRLKQILMNILSNSIKFTEKGSVKAEVKITNVQGLDLTLLFTITDTGQGIPGEKINSIFESFSQVENDYSKSTTGSGLGLAIVKQLVSLCGGEIAINSELGTGTVFKIELPFKLTSPLIRKKGPVVSKSNIEVTDLSNVHVLLVEDNKVNQFLAQRLLDRMGLKVKIASSGIEAIEFLNNMNFNVILMDVQMPEMDGYQLTELIRNSLPEPKNSVPIIALTAYASLQEKEKALSLGMSDYITKPYSPHELMTAITKQVALFRIQNADVPNINDAISAQLIRNTSDQLLTLFNNKTEDVLSLLYMLINQIPTLLNEVEKAIQNKNWPLAFQEIHKLRSSVNLLKLSGIINLASVLEEYSRDQINTEKIPDLFNQFRLLCTKAVGLLKEEVIRLKKMN